MPLFEGPNARTVRTLFYDLKLSYFWYDGKFTKERGKLVNYSK